MDFYYVVLEFLFYVQENLVFAARAFNQLGLFLILGNKMGNINRKCLFSIMNLIINKIIFLKCLFKCKVG